MDPKERRIATTTTTSSSTSSTTTTATKGLKCGKLRGHLHA
jgi:hypothetical protein